jgi:hypothetical protein
MAGSCEHGTEQSGLMNGGKFVDQLSFSVTTKIHLV